MIQKIVNTLKLDRPIRYYMLLYILVILLTYAGNFFFYKSVSSKEWVSTGNYIKSLDRYSSLCMELTNNNANKCLNKVEDFAKNNSDYYGHLVLINGNTIIDNRRYKDDERLPMKRIGNLPSIDASIEVVKNPIPSIWLSVFRSATFSAYDIVKKINKGASKEKIWGFVTKTAMWRSFPHLSFLFIVFFVSAFMKRSIIAQTELINELEELEEKELEELEESSDNNKTNK